eukprot:IDg1909t1
MRGPSACELSKRDINEELFECEEEVALFNALKKAESKSDTPLMERLEQLAALKNEVDGFLDNVFVNAEDHAIRDNRVTLSARVVALTGGIVDLMLLQI